MTITTCLRFSRTQSARSMKAGGSGFQAISPPAHSTGPQLTLNFTGLTNGGDWQGKPENDVTFVSLIIVAPVVRH